MAVQPKSTTVTTGETMTVGIAAESADDGVGSVDLELTVADAEMSCGRRLVGAACIEERGGA
ncbi:hypothetical protein NDI56_20825 [Haloarcula sp. S1CR25-12]|uniref:Uncharacterized protein n=1 Tax=Haloarcula saliterrae TaxID=2950534 RepID=A0ABU2FHW0_9EURY|nr:hypothetical protein [Haloarcula sp. S1CR25-12]MDS0261852.1 hypothetical protein [Haloarcula sp. S1CR25-12]